MSPRITLPAWIVSGPRQRTGRLLFEEPAVSCDAEPVTPWRRTTSVSAWHVQWSTENQVVDSLTKSSESPTIIELRRSARSNQASGLGNLSSERRIA